MPGSTVSPVPKNRYVSGFYWTDSKISGENRHISYGYLTNNGPAEAEFTIYPLPPDGDPGV